MQERTYQAPSPKLNKLLEKCIFPGGFIKSGADQKPSTLGG